MENILITGISGQDGIFLANILLNRDEELIVHGTSRGKEQEFINNQLKKVGTNNLQNLKIYNLDLENKNEVEDLINRVSPNKIFNLSGPSSVYDSFNEPKLTEKTILTIFNNLIEVLISKEIKCNFFQASSSEMFSPNLEGKINESSKLEPNSPYAKAKVSNHKKLLTRPCWHLIPETNAYQNSLKIDNLSVAKHLVETLINIPSSPILSVAMDKH